MTSITQQLAEFAVATRSRSAPSGPVQAATRCLLDGLGVAVAALGEAPTSSFLDEEAAGSGGLWGDGGDATQLGSGRGASPWSAALVNGTLIHSLDYDDGDPAGAIHPGASIVPAALAAAEWLGSTDSEILDGLVIGYELSMRIARAGIDAFVPNGFHPTSLCGTLGAAATVASMMGLDVERVRHAIGLSTSFASGLTQGHLDGSSVKKLHGGWAAGAGLTAAWMAAKGFTGPLEAVEGPRGLFPTHAGDKPFDLEALVAGLGERWLVEDVSLKPYPCCHLLHAPIEAVRELRTGLASVDQVERIEVLCPEMSMQLVARPVAEKTRPSTSYGAKFSLQFGVAAALLDDNLTLGSFDTERLRDPSFTALVDKVECRLDPDSQYPPVLDAQISLFLADGRVLTARCTGPSGSSGKPLSTQRVREKFMGNCAHLGVPEDAELERIAGNLLEGRDVIDSLRSLNRSVVRATRDGAA